MSVIEVNEISRTFYDFWHRPVVNAVDKLSFSVEPGEVVGLIGPNGCGKSTTIKMLLGLLKPSAGHISVMGVAPGSARVRALTGYLPELSHLHPFLTPRETLHYYGGLFGLSRHELHERTTALLAMVKLTAAADRRIGTFSKGMTRRVGLAQALINNPQLLILDEPTSGLDPIGTREVKDWILALKQLGVTIVMSSHLLGDVADCCDRILMLNAGKACAFGRVAELLRCPDAVRFTVAGCPADREATLQAALQAGAPDCTVTRDYPAMSLERYFLQQVDAGASATEALAPFLTGHTLPTEVVHE